MKERIQRKREANPFEKCVFRNSQPVGDDDCKIVLAMISTKEQRKPHMI